nr:integrase, catalytic region, zinc finger, CCHC-type, peptidase aspartic, catalytic [Tanacetum cinerariifolium]
MVTDSNITLERTYQRWLSQISIPSPRTNEFEDWVKLSDPKQALRGRQPMLILVVVMNKCCYVEARLFHFSCFVVLLIIQEFLDFKESDGENLDKMKEKGDEFIFVGYSTQSRAYRVFNKRTRVIMESIHVNFDELPHMASVQNSTDPGPTRQEMASVQISSDPAPECQTMSLEHDSLSPGRNCQENVSHGDRTEGLSKTVTALTLPQTARQAVTNTNVLKPSIKCLVDSDHFACVTKMLNDVNARTKKPNVVPISTRKPKGQANKFVATPYKKKVASKSTTQKPKSYYRMLDGENLDKMKEKGDLCILVGYSTQSKGYRAHNKRTRLIVETIHIRFEEIKEMYETSVANDTSGLVPQRQKASDYDNSDTVPQVQNVSSSADAHVTLQQQLDLLFGPLYDEFVTAGTSSVNKSFSPTNNSN